MGFINQLSITLYHYISIF